MLALYLAQVRGTLPAERVAALWAELASVPAKVEELLRDTSAIEECAGVYKDVVSSLFLGRGIGVPDRDGGRAEAQGDQLHPRGGATRRVR